MDEGSTLNVIKQCFQKILPDNDPRTKISHLDFIVALVFSYLGDSKMFSLEAIRRNMISRLNLSIGKSSFWERLSRKRLKDHLKGILGLLMTELVSPIIFGQNILTALNISAIYLVDSSSISLWDGAKEEFPGTRTTAGIKWHTCFDLLVGKMNWFEITPTSTHDRKCFPRMESLRGVLVIFDLGYWDYGLLLAINKVQGFFLSRIKVNSKIKIRKIIKGISLSHLGKKLSSLTFKRRSGLIVELLGEIFYENEEHFFRVIGFWNPATKTYHWYITNLKVKAALVYPLYRIRWQLELIFKACKNSLNANQITSNHSNIIESLLLASLVAHLASSSIMQIGSVELNIEKKLAISFQRIAMVAVILSNEFIDFLVHSGKKYFSALIDKIKLFSNEIFDPNFNHRHTSLKKISKMIKGRKTKIKEMRGSNVPTSRNDNISYRKCA